VGYAPLFQTILSPSISATILSAWRRKHQRYCYYYCYCYCYCYHHHHHHHHHHFYYYYNNNNYNNYYYYYYCCYFYSYYFYFYYFYYYYYAPAGGSPHTPARLSRPSTDPQARKVSCGRWSSPCRAGRGDACKRG
jgi:hypothetical protein